MPNRPGSTGGAIVERPSASRGGTGQERGLVSRAGEAVSGGSRCSTAPPVSLRHGDDANAGGEVTSAMEPPSRALGTPRLAAEDSPGRRHRVSMVCPKSLADLQARAMHMFGKEGCLRLYHHGQVLIKAADDLSKVRHGDVIVVTWDDRKLSKSEFANLMTTYSSHYVQHPVCGAVVADTVRPLMPSQRFDAQSSYRMDFAEPLSSSRRQDTFKPRPVAITTNRGGEARTAYTEQFEWKGLHHNKPLPPPGPALNLLKGAMPLHAETSYKRDFGQTHRPANCPIMMPKGNLRSEDTRPKFSEETTYQTDFPDHGVDLYTRPRSSSRVKQVVNRSNQKTESATEYRERFDGQADKPVIIHLEPARTPRARN